MRRIAIVGAGAFGTALAVVLASAGRDVTLWMRSGARASKLRETRENAARLPGVRLPGAVVATAGINDLATAQATLLVLPAQETESFMAAHGGALADAPVVLCAKGIDAKTHRMQSEIAAAHCGGRPLAVLTGPGFAGEIARGLPTALTLACADRKTGAALQTLLSTGRMRLYLTSDLTGAQLGGSLKNVIAIACGLSVGAGLGESARAALMTRGFAEMTRLAEAMGASRHTLAGLSGLGDLALTCTSAQSRNFAFGQSLGAGSPAPAGKTVEGIKTALAVCVLAARYGVDMPIAGAVKQVLDGGATIGEAMEALLSRPLKEESRS
ncbi:MAG: NAD(P)H-dependent glycerol-3-phosphate dehydrogenase [Paracoccaceae bacterium]